ncbi:MAG: trigger factor family protein [Anaerolineae bacterium]|nr:trigger factor family protein [Anaerolineae bacterium]
MPGFRPGKAPYHMIVRHLGEGRILEEAIESLIDELYPQVLDESGVKPYGPGKLENLKLEDAPPTAQFLIPLAPEVSLGEYQSIRMSVDTEEVTEEKVDEAIKSMREMYAEVSVEERPAKELELSQYRLIRKIYRL